MPSLAEESGVKTHRAWRPPLYEAGVVRLQSARGLEILAHIPLSGTETFVQ